MFPCYAVITRCCAGLNNSGVCNMLVNVAAMRRHSPLERRDAGDRPA